MAASAFLDTHRDVANHIEYERTLAMLRAQMDDIAFAAAWAEGRAMTMDQAIAYAFEDQARRETH
jgi:hypothetical protein